MSWATRGATRSGPRRVVEVTPTHGGQRVRVGDRQQGGAGQLDPLGAGPPAARLREVLPGEPMRLGQVFPHDHAHRVDSFAGRWAGASGRNARRRPGDPTSPGRPSTARRRCLSRPCRRRGRGRRPGGRRRGWAGRGCGAASWSPASRTWMRPAAISRSSSGRDGPRAAAPRARWRKAGQSSTAEPVAPARAVAAACSHVGAHGPATASGA